MKHGLQCFFIVGQVGQEVLVGGHIYSDAAEKTLLRTRRLFYLLFLFFSWTSFFLRSFTRRVHSVARASASKHRSHPESSPARLRATPPIPRRTTVLRPFLSRISTLASPGVLGPCPATCTSRNFVGVCSSSRFFHTKKYGRHKPCSRQNAFTLCPLRACSETSLRHFIQAFFERLVMSQHCIATRIFTRWGSLSAHKIRKKGAAGIEL